MVAVGMQETSAANLGGQGSEKQQDVCGRRVLRSPPGAVEQFVADDFLLDVHYRLTRNHGGTTRRCGRFAGRGRKGNKHVQ